jgi:hypothetical protein
MGTGASRRGSNLGETEALLLDRSPRLTGQETH